MTDQSTTTAEKKTDQEWHPRFNPWIIAASVMLTTFMEILDTSVANVALPHIAGSLSADANQATWVLTSYLVTNAVILPATGWLSRYFGRKRLLITCIIVFTGASVLCGAAANLGMLIASRILQGLGGGALQPIAQAILLESFPPEKRGVAMATFGMGVVFAPIIGPTLGGWITDSYSWRWVFYINLPVGILAAVLASIFVEDPPYIRQAMQKSIDYIGFSLMALSLGSLQLILDKGQEEDWFSSNWICWFAVISGVALILFIIHEVRTEEPIVNLRIFNNRNFAAGTVIALVLGTVLYSTTAMLPLFLQLLMGYPALQSGMSVSPRGVGSFISLFIMGRIIGLVDTRILIACGFTLLAFATSQLGRINLDINMFSIIWPNILNGLGMASIFVPLSTMTVATLRLDQIGGATGIYNLMRNLGGGLGIALATTMLSRGAQAHQGNLISRVSNYDPAFQQNLNLLQGGLSLHSGPILAAQQAYGVIYKGVLKQAMLLAFVDNFHWISLLCLSCIPLVVLFKKVKAKAKPAQRAAH